MTTAPACSRQHAKPQAIVQLRGPTPAMRYGPLGWCCTTAAAYCSSTCFIEGGPCSRPALLLKATEAAAAAVAIAATASAASDTAATAAVVEPSSRRVGGVRDISPMSAERAGGAAPPPPPLPGPAACVRAKPQTGSVSSCPSWPSSPSAACPVSSCTTHTGWVLSSMPEASGGPECRRRKSEVGGSTLQGSLPVLGGVVEDNTAHPGSSRLVGVSCSAVHGRAKLFRGCTTTAVPATLLRLLRLPPLLPGDEKGTESIGCAQEGERGDMGKAAACTCDVACRRSPST